MKIAVWKTGHEIADKVADAVYSGLKRSYQETKWPKAASLLLTSDKISAERLLEFDCHIAYGILRGTAQIFHEMEKRGKHWFNIDRGYFNPGHYDGYYRISYRGTQARFNASFPATEHKCSLEPFIVDFTKPVLICPPTEYVKGFFNRIEDDTWVNAAINECKRFGLKYKVRTKDFGPENAMQDVMNSCMTYTFNCSLGWKGLIKGIPCLSDTTHSVVGPYYNTKCIDTLIEKFNSTPREPLLNFMRAHQFTLEEIRQGQAWSLIKHYLYSSATTPEKPLPPMSQPTPSANGLKAHFQSNI